jgi:hypothetical protein
MIIVAKEARPIAQKTGKPTSNHCSGQPGLKITKRRRATCLAEGAVDSVSVAMDVVNVSSPRSGLS